MDLDVVLAEQLAIVFAASPVGESIEKTPAIDSLLQSLELAIPAILRRRYPEWEYESLDGIILMHAARTAEHSLDISGLCILISDQTYAPIQLRLINTPDNRDVQSIAIILGERSNGKLLRRNLPSFTPSTDMRQSPSTLPWMYSVIYGD